METRPLDTLNESKGKNVIVELKNQKQLTGKLIAIDMHVNTVLHNCEEKVSGETVRKLGIVFIRGDMIVFISPA